MSRLLLSLSIPSLLLLLQPARSPAAEIAGLDSLTAATLEEALARLEIDREALGFDKLYAADDTFRLAIVEELLVDPLALPAWQTEQVEELSFATSNPAALVGRLGGLCDAPGEESSGSVWPWAEGSVPLWSERSDLGARVADFIAAVEQAEIWLESAFAALDADERERLLVVAPAFWSDAANEPAELARKGLLHRELGAPADTTIELSENFILDLAVQLDRRALTRAAQLFLSALTDLTNDLALAELPPPELELPGASGLLIANLPTPWGFFLVGGPGNNSYEAELLARTAFLIEVGGDDSYRGRAASAVGTLLRPFGALVDYAGADHYEASAYSFCLGGALLGVAALVDLEGDDIYRGEDAVLGAGFFGVGIAHDGAGVDFFAGRNFCQGAGAFGLGALVSDAFGSAPPGPEPETDRAYQAGLTQTPGTGALPIRFDDNDTYLCARQSQGFASTFGAGLLFDWAGSDTYRSGGRYLHRPLLPNDFQSLSQGYSIGFRPRAGGGVGLLIDHEGNDFYDAEVYAQGVGYWYSIGMLFDGGGNDLYYATQYAQAAGVHLALGSLWDRGGDDRYVSRNGVVQGTGHDLSAALLLDEGGRDTYVVSDGQGIALSNSVGLFIDTAGDDHYATTGAGQGTARWARGFSGAGIFLDLEGNDTYPALAPGADGAIWQQSPFALGIDLPRDLVLPSEKTEEIVLSAEDSLRSVAELFETASIWEVGNARDKVRRARKALEAKGMEAVHYVVNNKLGVVSGLEFRALQSIAEAFPDSFAALALPHLRDERPRTRANVIALLGELKHAGARAELIAMLGMKEYERDHTRLLRALGKIGEPEAAPAIRPFLNDAKERRRIAAVVALAALRDTVAVEALSGRLNDAALTVRSAASQALIRCGVPAVEPLCAALLSEQGVLAPSLFLRTLGRIAYALRDNTDAYSLQARAQARRRLMEELACLPKECSAANRAVALRALWALGDQEGRDFVRLRMLDEADPLVRRTFALCEELEIGLY